MIVTVWSGRGTVGKSLIASNLVGAIATAGKNVMALDADEGAGDLRQWVERFRQKHRDVSKFIVTDEQESSYVIIDCPPGDNPRAREALELSNLAIVPTTVGPTEIARIGQTIATAQQYAKKIGIVLTGFDARAMEVRRFKADLLARHPTIPIIGEFPHRQVWKDAWREGRCAWQRGILNPVRAEWQDFESSIWKLLNIPGW